MPSLPREFYELITDADLPLDDESSEPLEELSAAQLEIVAAQAANLLGQGWGAFLVDLGVDRARIPAPLKAADLRADAGFAALAAGDSRLAAGAEDRALIKRVQDALQALAGRIAGAPKELALAVWGADGDFGEETTRAVKALQRWRELEVNGVFAGAEAEAVLALLDEHAPPDLFAPSIVNLSPDILNFGGEPEPEPAPEPEVLSPAVQRIVNIARGIAEAVDKPFEITVQGKVYSYKADHFGVPPAFAGLLRAPGGFAYGVRPGHEYWKCNVFGGTVLALAEVPVPGHRVGKFRHFPRAERFGDSLARSRGWRMIHHLDHRDPANPEAAILGEQQNAEIRAMLADIRPGDMFFADNPGPPGSDGGHTRVCVAAADPDDPDCAPLFAQARRERAQVQRDGMMRVSNGRQIQFWVVRYTG
ncbi:MAG: peptidoglycan-binding protein [Myxococcales bacterium]|nr:peptidoglycan-binding protein [Myxococcales bacterium]